MRKNSAFTLTGLLLIIFMFSACQKLDDLNSIEDIDYNAEFAIPLINTAASLEDIIEGEDIGSMLLIDDNGNMRIAYETEGFSQNGQDFFSEMPSFPIALPSNSVTVPFPTFENIRLQKGKLKAGLINFDIVSNHTENINVKITIPNMVKNGQMFEATAMLDFQGSSPTYAAIPAISLEGYTLNIVDGMITMNYEATNNAGNPVNLVITGMAEAWTFSHIEGTWGRKTITLQRDTLYVDLYENAINGKINFEDPKVYLNIKNSFGFPVMIKVKNFKIKGEDGSFVHLESSLIDDGLLVDYPAMTAQGTSATTTFTFDQHNSNIKEILSTTPRKLIVEIDAILNPDNDLEQVGFAMEESKIEVNAGIELPIYGSASGFSIEKDADIDMSQVDEVAEAEFKLIANNELPVGMDLQFYFVNSAGEVIDSIFDNTQNLLEAAVVNVFGDVVDAAEKTSFIPVSADRMIKIRESEKVIMNATFNTANGGDTAVRVLSTQEVQAKLGLRLKLQ